MAENSSSTLRQAEGVRPRAGSRLHQPTRDYKYRAFAVRAVNLSNGGEAIARPVPLPCLEGISLRPQSWGKWQPTVRNPKRCARQRCADMQLSERLGTRPTIQTGSLKKLIVRKFSHTLWESLSRRYLPRSEFRSLTPQTFVPVGVFHINGTGKRSRNSLRDFSRRDRRNG